MMDAETSDKPKFCGDKHFDPKLMTASCAQNTRGHVFCYNDDDDGDDHYVPLIRKSFRMLSLETFSSKCDASKRLFDDDNNHISVKKSKENDYNNDVNVKSMVSEALHETNEIVAWKPPPFGWVKMNSNGTCKVNGIAGCGGLIRGSDGEWLGDFAKHIGWCSAYVAELWGVLEGLKLARKLGFKAVEVNVDSLLVANTINNNKEGSSMGRTLVDKIRSLLALDWNVVVRHLYREANQCVDVLANFGCSLVLKTRFFESCPTQIGHFLLADTLGISVPRIILV